MKGQSHLKNRYPRPKFPCLFLCLLKLMRAKYEGMGLDLAHDLPIEKPLPIKGTRSYFSKFGFLFHLKNHHSKEVNLKFRLRRSICSDVRSNFVYCSCLYLTV